LLPEQSPDILPHWLLHPEIAAPELSRQKSAVLEQVAVETAR
jgi:hypothetical protein